MADNDQGNDEYQFDDLDVMTPAPEDETEAPAEGLDSAAEKPLAGMVENNIRRNALIGIAAFIFMLVVYKFIAAGFSTKSIPVQPAVATPVAPSPIQVAPPSAPAQLAPIPIQPVMPAPEASAPGMEVKINQTLSTMEVNQQGLRADVTSVNNQLGGVTNSLNLMMTKITELNGIITNLTAKVEGQAIIIERLAIRKEHKITHYAHHSTQPRSKFYIQAVIPGRAWLIATNGATLTVREGTPIVGYGIVKLIDPSQGKVMTSSGQVIRFSQDDS